MTEELSQQAWGRLADGMSAGLILIDDSDRYLYANQATEQLLGIAPQQLLGRPVKDVRHAMRMPLLLAMDMLKHGRRSAVTGRFPIKGLVISAEFSRCMSGGQYAGAAVLIRDTTEENEFCSNMLRIERMAVLGELAAAMAHEINSPLSGVMEAIRIVEKHLGNHSKVERFLPLAQRGLEQIQAIVGQMLTFARPHEEPRTRVVLEDVVEQCVDFLRCRESETGAELKVNLGTERTTIVADEHAFCQMLINLINNGLDAVAGRPEARVEVSTELLPSTGEVVVRVRDNGPGIPQNLRARIFDPFFTTKASGKGTGLGLSISARIAARHGGRIVVSDRLGGGAVVALVLPLLGLPEGSEHHAAGC